MGDVAGEVVGRELVFGIETFFLQILRPACELRPEALSELRGVLGLRDSVDEDEQIAALFNRHLIFFSFFAAAVDLSVGERVLAEVVRREGKTPAGQS